MHRLPAHFLAFSGLAFLASCGSETSQSHVAQTTQHPNCVGDRFALTGANAQGDCLDVTLFRAARMLRPNPSNRQLDFATVAKELGLAEAATKGPSHYLLIANFRHMGKFWVAQIPLGVEAIARTVFQAEEFRFKFEKAYNHIDPTLRTRIEEFASSRPEVAQDLAEIRGGSYNIAHGMLRLDFKADKPVKLASHDGRAHVEVNSIELSVHAVAPGTAPGEWDPIKGMQGRYGAALGVFSTEEKVNVSIRERKARTGQSNRIRQYKTEISSGLAEQILQNYASRSDYALKNLSYDTFKTNCGSILFDVVDDLVRPAPNFYQTHPAAQFGRQYPKYGQWAMHAHGFVKLKAGATPDLLGTFDDTAVAEPLPTLNAENGMADW